MRKILSIVIIMAICLGNVQIFARDLSSTMEEALVIVKEKIDIPQEADIFDSNSYIRNDSTYFSFSWHNEDHSITVDAECDSNGRISSYYSNRYYDDKSGGLSTISKEQAFAAADAFIRKALPELFENSNDCLTYNEAKSVGRVYHDSTSYTFSYDRLFGGIPVLNNSASVFVSVVEDDIHISAMSCSWYYDIEFEQAQAFEGDIISEYFKQYPTELVYNKQYSHMPIKIADDPEESNPVFLIYRFKDGIYGYISASTGEIIKVDYTDEYGFSKESSMDMAASGKIMNGTRLSPAELEEIDRVKELVTKEDIEKKLKAIPELKLSGVSTNSFSVKKNKDDYFIDINMSLDDEEKEQSHYFNATLNGKTGEILSLSNRIYDDNSIEPTEKDYEAARKMAESFVVKTVPDKYKLCVAGEPEEKTSSVSYTRLVNGVRYINNAINASAAERAKDKYITYYSIDWDEDVSSFADPAKAISEAEAHKAIDTLSPIKEIYVLSEGRFVKCVAPSEDTMIHLDALTGEPVGEFNSNKPEIKYSDIEGHWAEAMITALADVNIGLDKDKLEPDNAITQSDFLRLMLSTFYTPSYFYDRSTADVYEAASDIIPEGERDENAPVKREDAFFYMIKFMNYEKIAKMDIYRSDFADSTGLGGDRLGAVALLTGFGVIKGDDGNIRATDSITTAETFALIYNYLTNK